MDKKKGANFFLVVIAVVIGGTLFKHFDFENFSLKDPYLDALYFLVFAVSIFLLIKENKK
jgi:hypothetical protein